MSADTTAIEVAGMTKSYADNAVSERMIEGERDGWILIAARWPDRIAEWMPQKWAQLEDPQHIWLYRLLGEIMDSGDEDESRLAEVADIMVEGLERASAEGGLDSQDEAFDDLPFVDLLDALAVEYDPRAERLRELVRERGWTGWNRSTRLD